MSKTVYECPYCNEDYKRYPHMVWKHNCKVLERGMYVKFLRSSSTPSRGYTVGVYLQGNRFILPREKEVS